VTPLIFIISGKARVGKDTVGDFIIEFLKRREYNPIKMAYAKYLKMYAKDYFNWDGNEESKPRDLLQQLGTEIIRKKMNKPHFLVNRIIEDIEILFNYFDSFVITDAREEKEITMVKDRFDNAISIKINRNVDVLTDKQKKHFTEIALDDYDDYDYIINNDGSIDDLKDKVYNVLKEIL